MSEKAEEKNAIYNITADEMRMMNPAISGAIKRIIAEHGLEMCPMVIVTAHPTGVSILRNVSESSASELLADAIEGMRADVEKDTVTVYPETDETRRLS